MNNGKVDWEGCFIAVVTPFTETGEINKRAFCENISLLVAEGAEGIIVSGCTGEAWSLTAEERLELFKLAVDTTNGTVPLIAGTGGIRTNDVIDLSLAARDVGVSGIMLLPPYYCLPRPSEVIAFYKSVSDQVEAPILLYNIPNRTGVDLTPALLEEIVEIEHIVGIKESSGSFVRVETLINLFDDAIQVFTGHSAERGVAAVLMGAKGWVSSLETQIMGGEAIQMYDLVKEDNIRAAKKVQLRALALQQGMSRIGTFPANLKAGMNILGRPGGFPRGPLLPLSETEVEDVRSVLGALQIPTLMG